MHDTKRELSGRELQQIKEIIKFQQNSAKHMSL